MHTVSKVTGAFQKYFHRAHELTIRAPGRVNLIGEHTDYNDGLVLPMAIDLAVVMAARARPDKIVNIIALDYGDERVQFQLSGIEPVNEPAWSNYVRGVAALLLAQGHQITGMDLVFSGDIPRGAGLSSSATLLVAAATTICHLSAIALDKVSLARLCQRAENEFCGVKCGIMDHFVITLARAGHGLMIDCRDYSYDYVPLPQMAAVLVCDTMKRRELKSSEYNTRRAQCEEAVHLISQRADRPIRSLREISWEEFKSLKDGLPELQARRAEHVICENERVCAAQNSNAVELGRLMNGSHDSLRRLYEVSCYELDTMVEIAQGKEGVFGSRLTGAGFGGCTVSLVDRERAAALAREIVADYRMRTGLEGRAYIFNPAEAAGPILGDS